MQGLHFKYQAHEFYARRRLSLANVHHTLAIVDCSYVARRCGDEGDSAAHLELVVATTEPHGSWISRISLDLTFQQPSAGGPHLSTRAPSSNPKFEYLTNPLPDETHYRKFLLFYTAAGEPISQSAPRHQFPVTLILDQIDKEVSVSTILDVELRSWISSLRLWKLLRLSSLETRVERPIVFQRVARGSPGRGDEKKLPATARKTVEPLEKLDESSTGHLQALQAHAQHSSPTTRAEVFTLLNDDTGSEEIVERSLAKEADRWFRKLRPIQELLNEESKIPVKVAVLDTGLMFDPDMDARYPDRYESYCFVGTSEALGTPTICNEDEDGHGTHVVHTILETGTNCKVYAARICKERCEVRNDMASKAMAGRIAKVVAIRHATDIWKVDIISMSFGFQYSHEEIRNAIKHAYNNDVLVLAAAGNSGSLDDVKYPARDPHTLCVYAATGYGDVYKGNPKKKESPNIAILGVAVEGCVSSAGETKLARRSGTSQATAVLAGIAALILQILRDFEDEADGYVCREAYDNAMSQLCGLNGMRSVFQKMSETNEKDGYRIIEPWTLLRDRVTTKERIKGFLCHDIVYCVKI